MKFAAVVAIIPLCESPIWLFSCKTLASSVTEAHLLHSFTQILGLSNLTSKINSTGES